MTLGELIELLSQQVVVRGLNAEVFVDVPYGYLYGESSIASVSDYNGKPTIVLEHTK